MGVVYFSIIPTFEPSRYCKCWIVCFYHIKLPGVIGNTLTWIGQASYHIFLVQMVYYHFELGGRLMASTWYIALPFNILVTVAAGLAFYEADCRFIRNMKYLKFKAKRRVA